ncbi:MAG: hypothetical protein IME96_13365, partial [Proteobacteria bacterium]|nr:hypothetical protein [Pseudomonadota bacterium]
MLEEFSGKQIDKTFQFFNRRRLNQWLVDSIPFETEPHLGRFMIIASLVAGRDVRVIDLSGDVLPRPYRPILHKMAHPALLPAHGFGWTDGETIYLPLSLIDMKGAEEQENLAILLIFFLSSQIKYGSLTIPAENMNLFESDQLLSDIYWIVENGRLSSLIFSVFPGMSRKWEGIVAHLIKRRPGKSHLGVVEGQVEALLEKTITALLPDEMTSASSVESLSIAQTIKGKWIDEGMSIRKYRGMVPFSPWGRLVPGRIKSDIVGQVENVMTDLPSDKGAGEAKENDEKKGRYITKRESINEEDNEQGLALNIFDKIMSWARFVNVTRPFDDDPDEDSKKKADEMEE